MTLRKWITFASAAALIAGVGACNDNKGGSSAGGRTSSEPQGRRADQPSRLGADAGMSDTNPRSSTSNPSSPAPTSPNDSSGTSGSSSDTTKR